MSGTLIVWVVCSALVFAALVIARTSVVHRRLRVTDLDWKAVLVIAAVVGAVPAFAFSQASRFVSVPAEVNDRGGVVDPAAR